MMKSWAAASILPHYTYQKPSHAASPSSDLRPPVGSVAVSLGFPPTRSSTGLPPLPSTDCEMASGITFVERSARIGSISRWSPADLCASLVIGDEVCVLPSPLLPNVHATGTRTRTNSGPGPQIVAIDGKRVSAGNARRLLERGPAPHGGRLVVSVSRGGGAPFDVPMVLAPAEAVAYKAKAWEELSSLAQVDSTSCRSLSGWDLFLVP